MPETYPHRVSLKITDEQLETVEEIEERISDLPIGGANKSEVIRTLMDLGAEQLYQDGEIDLGQL